MYEAGAAKIIRECLAVQPGESVLVLSDGYRLDMVEEVVKAAEAITSQVELIEYPEPDTHGEEPPDYVAEAMAATDIFIAPTRKSLTHTTARQEACAAGGRGATLPGITPSIWTEALTADYKRVKQISADVFDLIRDAETVTIETPSGTDLIVEIDSDYFEVDTGIYDEAGSFGNLPAGEVDGPIIDAEGVVTLDHCQQAPEGTVVEIKDGRAVSIDTESDLNDAFAMHTGARQVAELGIGTNPQATLVGNILQDEKVKGTCHIAFGDNTSYVPTGHTLSNPSPIHYDAILKSPTVIVDGTVLLSEGNTQFSMQ